MANLLSWLGGVANGIGGQINRTANQVQRNVVNPAVNFGVRNVQQAQRNVAQLPANVQRGAFDLQQQANNARKQAEEEARRIAEQRTREIMSIGNQAQQGFRQTSNMVTAPVRVLNKSSQGVKVDQSQVVQDLIPIARLAKTADLARQGKFMQAAQNTMRVPFASEAADISRQMAANSADQYHAGPKIPGVNLPTRAEIEDNKMFARSVENAGNKTIGAVQNAPGVRKVLDGQLPGGFTLRQAGAFANDSIAKPTLMQANDMGEAIAGNNDQARLDRLGYTNDLKGASKLVYDTVSLASLGYSGTKAMQLVKAPTLGGALKIAPSVAARQFGSGVAQNTALQLSQGTPVQQLDPMQIALAGGTYALLGTGLPLTGKVAGKGLSKVGQAIDIQRAKPIMSAIETQKFADTMRKVTPQTAPDIPTKGKMVSQGYQDVSVDFKPKPVTNDFTGKILDDANYKLRNGQISEKQYKAFIVDDYTKRTGKLPTDDEVQGFVNVAKEKPYAKLEQLREQYSKPIADTVPQVGKTDPLIAEARKYKSAEEFVNSYGEPVYHGSRSSDITEFNLDNLNATYMKDGLGINFTNDRSFAELYRRPKNQWGELASKDDGGGKVYKRYIKATNPLDLTASNRKVSDIVSLEQFKKIAKDGSEIKGEGRKYLERIGRSELTTATNDSRVVAKRVSEMTDDQLLEILYGTIKNKNAVGLDAGLESIFRESMFNYKLTESGKKELVESFRKHTGFDAFKTPKENGNYVITTIDPSNIKTKQQLTDLYNQAHAEAKTLQPTVEAKQSRLEQYGWRSETTSDGTKVYNRNGKHVATIKQGKNGRLTSYFADGEKMGSAGGSIDQYAEKIATQQFYAKKIEATPQNTGGTLRPDMKPIPTTDANKAMTADTDAAYKKQVDQRFAEADKRTKEMMAEMKWQKAREKFNTAEEYHLSEVDRLYKKYKNKTGYADSDIHRLKRRIINDHFDELDPETQVYFEHMAPGTDFENISKPSYRGFADASGGSGTEGVHASQIYELEQVVDEIRSADLYNQATAPQVGKTPMKPGSDSFKTDTVENIIKDLKGVSQEFRDKVGSNINKNISVEEVPFSKLIRTKTPASKRLSSVEKLGSTDYVTVIKEGNRYRPVDGQHRIAVAENSGKSSLKMIVANSDSNMTTEQIKNQFGKAIAPEPKTAKVSIAELQKNDTLGLMNTKDDIAAGRLSRTKGPVEVVKTSEGHLLIDGNHRALEAQMAGKSTVDAIVLSPEEAMKKYGDYLPQLKFVLDATGDLPVDKLNRPIYETAPKPTKLPTTPGGTPLKPVNTNRIFDYKSDGVRPVIDPKHKSRVKVYENPYYKGSWSVVVDGKYAGELPNGGASAGNIYKIRDLLTEGRAIKAQDPETADIFKGLQPPKTVYELAPKPKESLPDVIQAGKEDVYYHGTTKSDAESMLKTGFNPKLSVRGKNTESPYALFVSKDKGRLAGDHSAGNYGDGTIVKVTPNTDVKLLDGQSRTWVDSMGQSRGAKESAEWAKKLQKQGYDGIQEANGEITILNPSKFTISEVSPKVKPPTIPSKNKVLPKGINKDDVVEAHQFGSTTKGMVGNDTDIAIFLDPEHPSFAKIGSEYNKKVGKTEYHVFPDNDEGHAVFDAMLDYKDPKYGTGKGIAVKLNKDTIFSTDSIKKDRFGVPFKEESVPVAKLTRNQEYQPRIGQSGEATTANVFKKGYQEGLSDQPMLVRKEGDKYTVLGGHSRTMGIEQRAKAGLDNPTNIKARVYENITDEQARQISRGANQGAQYESTLDMAKSISASISENKAPSVQKQNMVKGFGHDDYKYLWDVVKDNNILKEKVNAGGISAEETLAIARQGRVKGLEPEKVAGVIQGLDKAGKLTRQNAKNVINLLSGKIKAGQMRTNQIGMFGDVEKAVKAVDLLDEYQKVSAELVKKRNALAIATDTLDKKSPAYKELRLKVKEYGQKLKTVETEVVNQYNAKISKNVPEIPSKTPPPPKPPTKKVRMNEYGELQVKERGFVTTVKNSPQTTPEVAKGVKGKYEPINNIDTLDTARKEVGLGKSGRVNNKKAYEEAIDTAKRSEDYSTETQAQSLILIEHLQSKGRTQDAIDIVEKMSERATKNGQASQILAAYNRLKPEGVLMMAQREIDKAKAMNPTKYADLKIEKVQATKLRKMATELQGLTGDERIVAQKEMLDEIGRLVPTPNMTKAVTLWKAGLLTGIKGGVSGNAVGNASNILVKKIADAPASAIDTVITQFTGNRSKVFTLKGWLSGFGEGLKDGKKQIQLGTGADDLASKLDYKKVYFSKNNPAGRFAQKYTDFVFGFYSASDKPWKMAALKNSLTDLATVEAKNKGLKGAAKAKFIKETVEAPPDNLLVQATNDSLDATFQDATALGGMLSGAKRSLAKHGPVAGAVGEVVAPFTGIPSSVATKMYRYSLVSSAVDIVRAIKASNKGQFDQAAQRKVSESIGKGLTGTALLGTGYALWNAGLMTTGMPQDPKERDLWELEGKQPWSVKVGGEWLSLNYTGPVLAILGAGATAAQSIKEGNTLPQTAFIAGMGTAKAVLESSPLKGVQSTLDVISDPARNGPRYLESLAGSTIPTISADVASSIDPLQREAMSPLDAMTNRVPIWRYGLNPKLNPFGEPKANQAFGVQAIVDPFRMSEDRTTSLTTELRNLYNTNKDLGTMPSDFKKDFYGGDTKLNEKQIYDLTAKIKPEIKQAWEQIIADPRYQGLNPEQRKKVLDKAAEDIRAARKFETGVQGGFLNEGEARKKLETGAKRILRGGQTDYINKETGGEDTPKQKYETALNDYEDKKKNGEISSIDEIKIQKALKKLQAQSNFDQDTVDLYGLSLKEIDGYLKSQPNGGDIYQKLLALDDAMEAAGATRKFKNRKLVVSSGKKSTKGRKAKKGGKAKKGTAIKIPSISGSAYKAPKFVTRKIASRKLSTKALPKIKAGKVYV